MTGSFEGNERAIGAQFAIETLRNMVTESNEQQFSRSGLLGLLGWMLDAIAGADEELDFERDADIEQFYLAKFEALK